jgi:hypothetical protein
MPAARTDLTHRGSSGPTRDFRLKRCPGGKAVLLRERTLYIGQAAIGPAELRGSKPHLGLFAQVVRVRKNGKVSLHAVWVGHMATYIQITRASATTGLDCG